MEDIFVKENEIIEEAEKLLRLDIFTSSTDAEHYGNLLDEYKKILKQMRSMVKLGDMMQGELNKLSHKLERMSNIDVLTDLYNRRYFNEVYQKEWHSGARLQKPLGVLMIDIDYFKKYNDTYGHLQGDKCLQAVANIVKKSVKRPRDLVARYGGEEFVVLLPETDAKGICKIAEKILANIEELNIKESSALYEGVFVSIGVAVMIPDKDKGAEVLLNAADEALYRAKNDGRNCYRE